MEGLFIKQEIALALKQKGFNLPCLAKWIIYIKGETIPDFKYNYESEGLWLNHNEKDVSGLNGNDGKEFLWSAPMFQQVVDWFRDEHNKIIEVSLYYKDDKKSWTYEISEYGSREVHSSISKHKIFKDYNQAFNKAIEEAINFI